MGDSTIEWTDATWNPTRGCTKISPGCKNCYAETFAERWRGVAGHAYERGFDPRLVPEKLAEPLGWGRPRRVFVNSMSDLFMDEVDDEYIAAVFGAMACARRHTFQVLTKRARRLPAWSRWVDGDLARSSWVRDARRPNHAPAVHLAMECFARTAHTDGALGFQEDVIAEWPLPNVHLGVSVEDKKYGLTRIEHLRETPAALRFLSIEPLLEDLGPLDLRGIGWVIVGGESGQRARECDVAAVRSVVAQCRAQGVPVFVKQLGRRPILDGNRLLILNENDKPDVKGKTVSRWPEDLRIQEFPR